MKALRMSMVRVQKPLPERLINKPSGRGLKSLENQVLVEGFQVSDSNHMLGVESRATLLRSLGQSLLDHQEIFGPDARPGNLVGMYTFIVASFQAFCQHLPG
jgi:hypothetical protein